MTSRSASPGSWLVFCVFFGPATPKETAAWIGVSQRDVKAALESLDVTSVDIEAHGQGFLLLSEDAPTLAAATGSEDFSFLSFQDNLLTVHGGPGLFTNADHHDLEVATWGGRSETAPLGSLKHLGVRTLLRGSELVGLWEFDPDTHDIATATFSPLAATDRERLDEQAADLGAFIRDQLGHGRSFNLDTDESMRRRVAAVAALS